MIILYLFIASSILAMLFVLSARIVSSQLGRHDNTMGARGRQARTAPPVPSAYSYKGD